MLIDLHMHEKSYSLDSHLSLEEMVAQARKLGLDGLCITDHDSMGLREAAEKYAAAVHFPIFVGIEFYSLQGDIVAFGVRDYPRVRVNAQEFIDCVRAQGGVCFAAHPFRDNHRGLAENLSAVRGLNGVEALNGSTLPADNQRAADWAIRLGLPLLGASDCHIVEKLGVYATCFPDRITSESDLCEAIRAGACAPAYRKNCAYGVWHAEHKTFWEEGVTPQRVVEYSDLHPAQQTAPAAV